MKKIKFSLILLLLMMFFFSCGISKTENGQFENLKIISLSPSNTEILTELSLGENIIGLDKYSSEVEGVNKEAEIFNFGDVNIEEIIRLNPNLVFVSDFAFEDFKLNQLKNYGIEIVNIETPNSLEGIYKSINLIGEETGKIEESKKIVENLKNEVSKIKSVNKDGDVKIYFEISPVPYLYSFGKDTYLNEIIEISGGKNIFGDLEGWLSPNQEEIIKLNPQIIFTSVNIPSSVDEIKNRVGWQEIDAVKNNNVYYIDENFSSRPSQFFVKALEQISSYIREFKNEK